MRRYLAYVILLVSLVACADAAPPNRPNCSSGGEICIELWADEPVSFGKPVTITLIVTSEKDIPELNIYFSTWPQSVVVQDPTSVEPGQVTKKSQSGIHWLVEIKGDQTLTFTRNITLPTDEGLFDIQAAATTTSIRAETSIGILLTREGGKVYLSGDYVPVTSGPELGVTTDPLLLETLRAMPTETAYPTLTAIPATQEPLRGILGTPAYPPPPGTPYP
jgi:hypothetical protein